MSDQPAPPLTEEEGQRPMKSKAHESSTWTRDFIRAGDVLPFSAEEEAQLRAGLDSLALPLSDWQRRVFATLDAERARHQTAERVRDEYERGILDATQRMLAHREQERVERERWQAAETALAEAVHRRQQALSLNDAKNERITAYARELAEMKRALAEERNVTDGWRRSHEKAQEERLHESQQAWERINQLISERDRATKALAEERQAREQAVIEMLDCIISYGLEKSREHGEDRVRALQMIRAFYARLEVVAQPATAGRTGGEG